jgi:imidazole glycerol-phosphate synthase subunit HisH
MIGIIDYEMGNLRSVQKALQHAGGDAQLIRTPEELARADKIVLPGVAAFGDAMEQLRSQRLVEPIVEAVKEGTPYLGFCLGLQLLFEVSSEKGTHAGLGLLPGKVVRFQFDAGATEQRLSVPHMGWNQITWQRDCPLLNGVPDGSHVYFAHSYYVVPQDESQTLTTTEYGVEFASAVWHENVFATQFHPEKSQAVGLQILRNFVNQ